MSQTEKFRYFWFETNLVKFLEKYSLPIDYEGEFLSFFETYKNQFLIDYKEILLNGAIKGYDESVYVKFEEQYKFVEKLFKKLIEIIKYRENSEFLLAERCINNILKNIEKDFFLTNIDRNDHNHIFYRIRIPNSGECFSNNPMELFHIPFGKRQLVRNDRYNFAGQPCLYLSTVLNIAWNECNLPTKFYYSKYNVNYEITNSWKFLCLCSPQEICNDLLVAPIFNHPNEVSDFIMRYLRTMPLIIASSVVNIHKNCPYKPEYIIPQMIMQWVTRNNDKIKGILYFPCTHQQSFRHWNGYNIVLPATNYNQEGYSSDLLKAFKIENPILDDNTWNEEDGFFIKSFYNKLQHFSYSQAVLADCFRDMFRNTIHALDILYYSEQIPSKILLSYIEMLIENIELFFNKHNLKTIINNAKNDECYQSRYEKDYLQLEELFGDFTKIKELIKNHYDYIERGLCVDKRGN